MTKLEENSNQESKFLELQTKLIENTKKISISLGSIDILQKFVDDSIDNLNKLSVETDIDISEAKTPFEKIHNDYNNATIDIAIAMFDKISIIMSNTEEDIKKLAKETTDKTLKEITRIAQL